MGIWLTLRLPPDLPGVLVDHGACIAHHSADCYALAGCRSRVTMEPWHVQPSDYGPPLPESPGSAVLVALVRCVASGSHGAVIVCSGHQAGPI